MRRSSLERSKHGRSNDGAVPQVENTTPLDDDYDVNIRLAGSGVVHGIAHFIQIFVFKMGILDGAPGLMISICKGLGSFLKYAKLAEINRKAANE